MCLFKKKPNANVNIDTLVKYQIIVVTQDNPGLVAKELEKVMQNLIASFEGKATQR